MSADKTFLALKNIIHNELGITRAELLEIAKDCIQDVVEQRINAILREKGHTLEDRVDLALEKEAARIVKSSTWSGERKMVDGIAKAVRDQIVISVRPKS